jgi:hypothetical protein
MFAVWYRLRPLGITIGTNFPSSCSLDLPAWVSTVLDTADRPASGLDVATTANGLRPYEALPSWLTRWQTLVLSAANDAPK